MYFRLLFGLIILLLPLPVRASGYSDFNLAITAFNHGDLLEAEKRATAALGASDFPQTLRAPAYQLRGDTYFLRNRDADALADYNLSLQLAPDLEGSRLRRGALHVVRADYAAALDDFDALIVARPHYPLGYAGRGGVFEAQKRFDLAIAEYGRMLKMSGKTAQGYLLRGYSYRSIGKLNDALSDFDDAVDLEPSRARGYLLRGLVYQDKLDFERALKEFQTAASHDPVDFNSRFEVGITLWQLSRFEEAEQALAALLRKKPDNEPTRLWLHLARLRSDQNAVIDATGVDAKKWPGALFGLFQGKATVQEARAAAALTPEGEREMHICEAVFYGAEMTLTKSPSENVIPLLEDAAKNCPLDSIERNSARAELERLR